MTTQMILRMERDGLSRRSCSLAGIKLSLENFSKSLKKLAYEYCSIKSDEIKLVKKKFDEMLLKSYQICSISFRSQIDNLVYFRFP